MYTVAVHDRVTRVEISRYRFGSPSSALHGRIKLMARLKGMGFLVTAVGRERR